MKIGFWAVNLNMGDGSSKNLRFQTKAQARQAVENNDKSQGEDWNDTVYEDSIETGEDDLMVLDAEANYYLEGIIDDM